MRAERWFYAWSLRLRSLLRRHRVDDELDEELRYHLQQQIEQHVAKGLTPEQARSVALRVFGGMERRKEECRDMRRMNVLEDLWKDVRHAMRVLRRSPAFTATAVLTLALGIGANTAIFSVVYGVLLKPLPFHEPDRLVGLWHTAPALGIDRANQGPGTYLTYRDSQRTFEDIGGWDTGQVSLTGRGDPERVEALSVTDNMLGLLKVEPALGRFFNKEDDTPDSPLRVILTHAYWQRRFGGTEKVIGQSLDIDGTSSEIIGVLPSSFKFLRTDPAVLLPMRIDPATASMGMLNFQALARLQPGVTLDQANADLARMIPLLPDNYDDYQFRAKVLPLADDVIGNIGRILWIILGTVGIVLLIACANVANLFLVRTEARQQELALRAALGASRHRIARELLSESLILALAGGAVGLALAEASLGLLRTVAPTDLPRVDEIGLHPTVLLFTLAISLLTGVLFGVIPILRVGTATTTTLKESGRSMSDAPGRHRTRNTLVVSEVALALVLLIVSGLMVRTFLAMRDVDPGFVGPAEVQTFRVDVPEGLIKDPQHVARLHEQIAQRLQQVPGVISVGLSSSVTMDGEDNGMPIFVEHVPVTRGEMPPLRRFKWSGPGYVETMGNRLLAGRAMTWTDIHQVRAVAVISDNLAREYWSTPSDALGKRIKHEGAWYRIVGVVRDERDDGVNQPATSIVYWPMLMKDLIVDGIVVIRNMAYVVRSPRVGSPGFLRELQQAVWSVNPSLPLADVRTLEEIQAESMAQTSFAMVMLALAAAGALLLGVVGIYGVIAYAATQRTREIGIRMALGAQGADVRRLFLRRGLVLTLVGIGLGLGAAMLLTPVMSALLFGVRPLDPVTYLGVATGLMAVALVATYLPARRASRVDPIVALRTDA